MVIKKFYLIGILLSAASASASTQTDQRCSQQLYDQAEILLVDARQGWTSLLNHQKKFAICDDGAMAEDYSDAVVKLLSGRWDLFQNFSDISKTDTSFTNWVIRHIDATTSDEDLKIIISNSNSCSYNVEAKRLCLMIRLAAINALYESRNR